MINIAELIQEFQIKKGENIKILYPRQEIIKKFVDRLNEDRDGVKLKKLAPSFVATRMYQAGLKDDWDLNWFYGYCVDSRNFSSCWWWALRAK